MVEPSHQPDRTVVISNAASGANARHGVAPVADAARRAGMRHHCIDGVDGLDGILEECARRAVSLIVVNAGDGTVCRILEIIREGRRFQREPAFALLRGGTTNMIHNDVGFPGHPAAGVRRLVACLRRTPVTYRERHVLRVSRSADAAGARYGFFLATNAAVRAIMRTRQRLHRHGSTGRMSELVAIAAMIWRLMRRRLHDDPVLAPVGIEYSQNGGPWRRATHVLMLATTVRTVVLGLRPLGRSQRAAVTMLNWPDYRLMPWLWRFLRGGLVELDGISLRGEFTWILDGEDYRHGRDDGELSIALDAPVRFLVAGRGR